MKNMDRERSFLKERQRLLRYWKIAGPLLIAVFLGLVVWLYLQAPLFIDPFRVLSRLEEETLDPSTLVIMAGLLPVVVITTLVVLAALMIFSFCAIHREKKYLQIIRELLEREVRER